METTILAISVIACALGFGLFVATLFRRVVEANMVHIVQSKSKTVSYGKGQKLGNVYYEWPAWIPFLGVTKTALPVSNFDIGLDNYDAYDKERLPFVVDIIAFFRVTDPNQAAERIAGFDDLRDQLTSIVQGAVRTVLAKSGIESIMEDRATFGEKFTLEVTDQLTQWGVASVKNIELMDIRDTKDSQVIHNIMAKKKSFIEMESRTEIAENKRKAETAEINAQRDIDLQTQEALQTVGLRTVDNEREVALSKQKSDQLVRDQEKITREKDMAIVSVQLVKQAEIDKAVEIVKADQEKQKSIIFAEGTKEQAIITAEGEQNKIVVIADANKQAKILESLGIKAEGEARAEAEKASQLASVSAQTALATAIGENDKYQEYLINIEKVKANKEVGIEQAKALAGADIKVITNSGSPSEGLSNVMDIFSSKGGTQIAAMLEALNNSEQGKELLNKIQGNKTEA
jgi:flotillin